MIDDDYEKLKREIVFEKVAKAIKEDPKNWIKQVEDLLSELIAYYLIACDHEQNLQNFEKLALQFYYDTDPDGFDALYELSEKYRPDSDKGKIVQEILRRQESEPDSIDF
jgi:hypothetical protein